MKNLSTYQKLIILIAAPLLALIYFSSIQAKEVYADMNASLKIRKLGLHSVNSANFVHEMQKERGLSLGYIAANGKKFSDEMLAQRKLTDTKLNTFKTYINSLAPKDLDTRTQKYNEDIFSEISNIETSRAKIDKLEFSLNQSLKYYTNINTKVLHMISYIFESNSNKETFQLLNSYGYFLLAKERAGIERALLTNAFEKKSFSKENFDDFSRTIAEQNIYINEFLKLANTKHLDFYIEGSKNEYFILAEKYRNLALKNNTTSFLEINSSSVFLKFTEKINQLKNLEDLIARDYFKLIAPIEASLKLKLALVLLSILLTLVIITVLSTNIIKEIHDLEQKTLTNLDDANDELRQFTYRTSHDLKAPLVSIESMVQLIEIDLDLANYDEVRNSVRKIYQKIIQLKKFISDVLALTKASSVEVHELVNLEEEIMGIKSLIDLEDSKVAIELDLKHATKDFKTNPTRLRQILQNLLSNAVKYRNSELEKSFVKISTQQEKKHLSISVADNGLGIADKHRDQVFSMFARFHTNSTEGSGLGLYLVKKHIESLGGDISCESKEGVGTSFTIKLPVDK